MRVSDTIVNFELINKQAQESCVFSSSGNKSFGDLSFLNVQTKSQIPFMTLELNQGILNGDLKTFYESEQANIAFLSNSVSNENCIFDDVWVEGNLGGEYNFIGVTLDFGRFYPKKVMVEYYKGNIKMLYKEVDEIENTWVYFDMRANEIDRVKVIFKESWAPYQYANLQEFLLGNVIEWNSDDVVSSNLQEETDIISKVVPNDTLSLTVYSKTDDFNLLNPRSSYAYLLPNQRFKLKEIIYEIDDETQEIKSMNEINMGEFYLDTWESLGDKQIKFSLVSPLAQLDKTQFKKSRMYSGSNLDSAYKILEEIFADADWDDYEIDESLRTVYLKGYIPVCTHKQAIHEVAFASGSMVYDNRSNKIVVEPFNPSSVQEISQTSIFDPVKVQRKESVTGITVDVHNFEIKSEREQVFKGYLEKGKREIIFSSPCRNLQSGSANVSILESGVNYAVLRVLSSGEYVLTGQKYEDKSYKYTKEITDGISVKKNNIDISKNNLINPNNVLDLTEKWSSYFKMYNLSIEFKFISNGQRTGQNISFKDSDNRVFTGAFVRQNIDIGKGFLSSCYLIGYQETELLSENPLFAGNDEAENSKTELYANENYGVI